MFKICVEPFFWIQLGAVGGQIEHFDVLAMRRQPRFHRLAVMDTQVIQNEEHFARSVFDQQVKELNQTLMIKIAVNDQPAGFALVGHAGDHGEFVTGATDGQRHRSFSLGCIAAAAHIGIHQGGLVSPVNLGTFGAGFFGRGLNKTVRLLTVHRAPSFVSSPIPAVVEGTVAAEAVL